MTSSLAVSVASSLAVSSLSTVDGQYRRPPIMHDSGLGSFGSESDTSPNAVQSMATCVTIPIGSRNQGGDVDEDRVFSPFLIARSLCDAYTVLYLGQYTLDRRYTQAMLPWVMAEVRRRSMGQTVTLTVEQTVVKARSLNSKEILFEHKLQTMTRFAKTLRDVKCFSYLTRPNVETAFTCHVFQAEEEIFVQHLFDAIRRASMMAVRGRSQSQSSDDPSLSSSRFFEVLYVGKVVVSTKKAPPTFIDDAVKKFDEYAKLQHEEDEKRMRHESSTSVQSLPTNLEKTVVLPENELLMQMSQDHGSGTEGTLSSGSEDAFTESNEAIPLSGSSCNNSSVMNVCGNISSLHLSVGERSISDNMQNSVNDSIASLDSSREVLTSDGFVEMVKKSQDGVENFQKQILQQQHQKQGSKIRTMLIQIGQNELSLISLDHKSTIFERQFKDISFCSQGISHSEHFGFISRAPETGNFTCYVFKCASESVVEEVMMTLKQAFQSAFEQSAKNLVICELCPMHQLHKLCQEIDRMSTEQMYSTLQQRLGQLSDQDQSDVMSQIKQSNPASLQETVEIIMAVLLKLCEDKQRSHVHINDASHRVDKSDFILTSDNKYKPSKFESFRNLAKKSITNSLEHFLGGHGHPAKEDLSAISSKKLGLWNATDLNPRIGVEDSFRLQSSSKQVMLNNESSLLNSPVNSRDFRQRRHSTPHNVLPRANVVEGFIQSAEHRFGCGRSDQTKTAMQTRGYIPNDSPIRSMFVKVGNNIDDRKHQKSLEIPSSGYRSFSMATMPHPAISNNPKRSWRLSILSRVVSSSQSESFDETDGDLEANNHSKNLTATAKERVKELWKKAIFDTVLLIRMDKENKLIENAQKQEKLDTEESKLDYEEITPCLKEVTKIWEQMLTCGNRKTTKFNLEALIQAVKDGVPRSRRGEIWQLLVEQHQLHYRNSAREKPTESFSVQYCDLLKQLTIHQHAILIDLGRTFPGHPYFSVQLGQGQLSLFNLLKAYSLVDKEVGYCQGLSFVAGILLMHMPEEMAYEILKYMMFILGFRRQYRPDMVPLQIQMYQLSRLLHDQHRDLYDHFEMHEIAPTLYAAPWFLTVFASQFPLGFVSRVFDLVFLEGTDIVLKVALVLLGNHKELIKQCDSFESVVEFLKTTLPEMGIIQMERIINQVFTTDFSKQLEAYEVEYHVLQEEMTSLHSGTIDSVNASDRISRLQVANNGLRRQRMELLEQLQVTRQQIHSLEDQNNILLASKHKLESQNRALELERKALLNAVTRLRQYIPEEALSSDEYGILASFSVCPSNISSINTGTDWSSINTGSSYIGSDNNLLGSSPVPEVYEYVCDSTSEPSI